MNTICFFPFTQMSPAQADAMAALANIGGTIKVLTLDLPRLSGSDASRLSDRGAFEFVSMDETRLARLDAQVQGFKDWAAIHRGNEMNLKAIIREKVWLNDDNSLSAIQSRIRSQAGEGAGFVPGGDDDVPQGDPLLVLRFAEILDMENQAIRQRLNTVEARNAALFSALKGETVDVPDLDRPTVKADGGHDPFEDIRSSQIEERIRAWCAAANEAGCFAGGANTADDRVVLATTSPAVMAFMTANAKETKNRLDIDSIKVHEQGCVHRKEPCFTLDGILETLTLGEGNPLTDESMTECHCPKVQIRLCAFSGEALNTKFDIPGGRQVVVCLVTLNS